LIDIRRIMTLNDYIRKRGLSLVTDGNTKKILLDDYEIRIEERRVILPIPLPTGKETLDDLLSMGIKYARASRISQLLGSPLEYSIEGNTVFVIKKFESEKSLEDSLIKALDGIEGLRYFL